MSEPVAAPAVTTSETRFTKTAGLGLLAVLFAVQLWVMRDAVTDMVGIWRRSETFAHCFFVLPIAAWLLRDKLQRLPAPAFATAPIALVPLALALALWLVGAYALIAGFQHMAVVGVLVSLIWLCTGTRFALYAAYPLGFLFLMVPFGEGLIPVFIDNTTRFLVAGLRLIGIPVYNQGNDLMLPSGNWSVVSACSGIRYLLAIITVSAVYAFLNMQSGLRRALFIAVAILIAVVGNWLRALGIVLLGHYSGMQLAVGADHILYGWVFFGILVAVLLLVGHVMSQPAPVANRWLAGSGAPPRIIPVTVAIGLLGAGALLAPREPATLPADLTGTLPTIPGWVSQATNPGWLPAYRAAPEPVFAVYEPDDANAGVPVAVVGYFFGHQGPGYEADAVPNKMVYPDDETWQYVELTRQALPTVTEGLPSRWFRVDHRDGAALLVAEATLTHTGWVTGASALKRFSLLARLRGKPDTLLRVFLFVPLANEDAGKWDYQNAAARLTEFLRVSEAPLETSFERYTVAAQRDSEES